MQNQSEILNIRRRESDVKEKMMVLFAAPTFVAVQAIFTLVCSHNTPLSGLFWVIMLAFMLSFLYLNIWMFMWAEQEGYYITKKYVWFKTWHERPRRLITNA